MLRIKLIRSTVAHQWRTRRVVESLGLRKINRVKELLHVEEVEGTPSKKGTTKAAPKAAVAEAPKKAKAAKATETVAEASEEKPKKKTTKKSEEAK